ncbi:hypothetical protein AGR7A_Cc160050 [Agrobacterium deltaense NCPPB 1641]|uniref:Uncharacterized protein n=1 Tax=Agrobacterium deltaense NCPPB 1641 TaxID=1183425 RepID=A0A1S7TKF1_9HYPH|nr:hypothetical protein AGR7A_Cc160050 [Agrobacterium deltaense NCPPB 1641]
MRGIVFGGEGAGWLYTVSSQVRKSL